MLLNSPLKRMEIKLQECEILFKKFNNTYVNVLQKKQSLLNELKNTLFSLSPQRKIEAYKKELEILKSTYDIKLSQIISSKEKELINLKEAYSTLNPKKREKRGFAEIVKDNKRVSLEELKVDDIFNAQNTKTIITAKVLRKYNI